MIDDGRKIIMGIRLVLLGATSLFLSGCGSAERPDYLTYWCATNTFEIEFARQVVAEWNRDTTHIPVHFQPVPAGQSSEEVIIAAIVGKTTPDIFSNVWPGVIEQYREAKAVISLSQFADFDSVLHSRLPPTLWAGFRSPDSQYYQLPWKGNPLVLFYNAGMLEAAGVTEIPRTYDEFFALVPKLVVDINGDGYFDRWMLDPHIIQMWWQRFFDFYTFSAAATGGRTIITGGRAELDRKESYEVMGFFREGFSKGWFPRSIFQEDIFLKGQLAFKVTGPWQVSYIKKYKPPGFRYGITPMLVPRETTGPVHTYGDPKSIVIFSGTRFPKQAWEFVKFMTSRANDHLLLELTSQLPLRRDLVTDPLFTAFFDTHPEIRFIAEQIPYIIGTDHTIYLQEIFDIISQEFDASCIHQIKTLEEAISDMQERVNKLLAREASSK